MQTKRQKREKAVKMYEESIEKWLKAIASHPFPGTDKFEDFKKKANDKILKLGKHVAFTKKAIAEGK